MWTITALDVGSIELEKSVGTYLTDCGKNVRITLTSFLIEETGGGRKVLVDTGPHSPEQSIRVLGERVVQREDQRIENALRRRSVEPEDIGAVILTHLHHDHCGGNRLFTRARFFVQRRELEYAFVPLPGEEKPYFSPMIGERPPFLGTPFEIMSGDYEVYDGLGVILTPGHTPGSQSVIARTPEGRVGLAGDNVFFFENLEKNLPVGHLYSRASWFESMDRLRGLTDRILPSHDPLLFGGDPPSRP